jgi:hypothetical protein
MKLKLNLIGPILMAISIASIALASVLDSMPPTQTALYVTWIITWGLGVACDVIHDGVGTWRLRLKHLLEGGLCSVWGIYVFGGPLWVQTIAASITALAAMTFIWLLTTEFIASWLKPQKGRR